MRKEVATSGNVVINAEFLLLPIEEQMRQVVLKIRTNQLKAEKKKKKNLLLTEAKTIENVEKTIKFFLGKNDLD